MKELSPRTKAESTKHRETSRHADVLNFCKELAAKTDQVALSSMGKSGEGQDMPVLVVSDRGCKTPEEAHRQKKAIVMVLANIHSGEVEGKEAILALARDLSLDGKLGKKLLSRLCLVIVPDQNPDGNDRISTENRRLDLARLEGQANPDGGVGTRYTGEGWNLNRDFMKQEAPETRNLARLFQEWWPHVFVDCHTSDGSIHDFDLTYDTFHSNQTAFAGLLRYTRGAIEEIAKQVKKKHGFRSYWYGNYYKDDDPESGWQTYPALPRFGSHYRGLQGRVDILLETYSYIPYKRRCEVAYAWLLEIFRFCEKDRKRLVRTVEREELRTFERGYSRDPRQKVGINYGIARRAGDGSLVFDYPAYALDQDEAAIEAFDRPSIVEHLFPGKKRASYEAPHRRTFVPTVEVTTPRAYLVPAFLAEKLAGHGIAFEMLAQEAAHEVDARIVLGIEKTFSPDVAGAVPPPGGSEVPLSQKPPPKRFETVLTVRSERRKIVAPRGTLLVRTAQRAGTLAVYLLEPCSDDGFARWEFLDPMIKIGEPFPIHRLA